MTVDRDALERAAEACRRGLLSLAVNEGSMFYGFPRGACGPASEIFGRLLQEEVGYQGIYVCGHSHPQLGEEQTHAWFVVGDYLVDVTHDQFNGTGLEGWVFELGKGWHALFGEQEMRPGACMPDRWHCYPHDGYDAALSELIKGSE